MKMKSTTLAVCLAALAAAPAFAQQTETTPPVYHNVGIPHLDHVFVIMMENHQYTQIIGNANAPFINQYATTANLAKNYWGVGHPSLTNYLEVIGGSNFDVVNDNSPDWHNTTCVASLSLSAPALEGSPNTCPIAGSGLDSATPEVDTSNEGSPEEPIHNIPVPAQQTEGKMIGDQLAAAGLTWKSYQENLPPYGADNVNNSDGLISNITAQEPGMPKLYAVKHNPFVYFASVQAGTDPNDSLKNVTNFYQLYTDLAAGTVPSYSFIAPNQCHDQHARGTSEVGTGCSVDQNAIAQGDAALNTLIGAIKSSPTWKQGKNVIVTVWDENDYSSLSNRVVAIVDSNYGHHGVSSVHYYTHFSLLKTVEAGFGLPYLNHANDTHTFLMTDLFN